VTVPMNETEIVAVATGLSDNATKIITTSITVLIWPAAVIILAIIFKTPIGSLLNRLKNVEVAGVKTEFNIVAEVAVDNAEAINVTPDSATAALVDQTASHPWAAVHQAWLLIQVTAREAVNGRPKDGNTTPERVKILLRQKRTSPDVYQLARVLTGLYWEMKKAPAQIGPAAATDYVQAAAKLVAALSKARATEATVSDGVP
jgi:hypothetical protein